MSEYGRRGPCRRYCAGGRRAVLRWQASDWCRQRLASRRSSAMSSDETVAGDAGAERGDADGVVVVVVVAVVINDCCEMTDGATKTDSSRSIIEDVLRRTG